MVSPLYETDGGYGVSPAYGIFQNEILDPVNLFSGIWNISPVAGVSSANQNGGILTVNFDGTVNVDYNHSQQTAYVAPDTFYRLTGLVKTVNLNPGEEIHHQHLDIKRPLHWHPDDRFPFY